MQNCFYDVRRLIKEKLHLLQSFLSVNVEEIEISMYTYYLSVFANDFY